MTRNDDASVACDEKGRIVIPKDLRERHGEEFWIMSGADGITLIPKAKDSVAALAELGKGLPDIPIPEMRRQAREAAARHAIERHERLEREARERAERRAR